MSGHVFFVRKDNLYLISKAKDMNKQLRKISPDEVIASLETKYPLAFEARLLRRYKNNRLPESSYFKFNEKQVSDCKRQFGLKSNIHKTLGEEFFIALTGSVLIFFLSFAILFKLLSSLSMVLTIVFALSSLPMFLLFFLGNFGGYNCSDLNLFSSWFNRIRALIFALIFLALSFSIGFNYFS